MPGAFITSDLVQLFQRHEFSDTFQIATTPGSFFTRECIIDEVYFESDPGAQVQVDTTQLMLTCMTSEVSNASGGTDCVVDNINYVVVSAEQDGQGITVLRVRRT